ncbi:Asp/Glu/hydantoin racemase [Bradyrhizobium sp. LB13.1]
MTTKIAAAARAIALPDTLIDARQPAMGPVSIEGFYDEAFAAPGMLGCIRDADRDGADAHIIACFDDTGLDAARAIATAPVIGIGEAGFHMASLIAARFAVVTTLGVSIVPIEHNLKRYGLIERCARVRAAEVPVLALEERNTDALAKISAEITAAIRDDRAEAIVARLRRHGRSRCRTRRHARPARDRRRRRRSDLGGITGAPGAEDLPARALCGAAIEDLCRAVFSVSALIPILKRPSEVSRPVFAGFFCS